VVVDVGDVDDDVDGGARRARAEERVVGRSRAEPPDRLRLAVERDATEQLAGARADAERATVVPLERVERARRQRGAAAAALRIR